jgi:glucokinase
MILAGDIGGTHARLALYADGGKGRAVRSDTFDSRAYKSLEAVIRAFLGTRPPRVASASFGIAGPVIDQRCVTTNLPWVVDARLVARRCGIPRVSLLNDLVALAFGALTVPPAKIRVLHGQSAPKKRGGNLAVIAAGTGLGEAGLVWAGTHHVALATEGGHTDFAPRSALECELFVHLQRRHGHVSYERIVSGPGFTALYDFFRDEKKMAESRENQDELDGAADRNAAIASLGASGKSAIARRALDVFSSIYGAEAGNLALKTLASAGVYVAGGIAIHLAEHLAHGPFVEAFLDKGRFRTMLEAVPVAIVLDANIGLAGARYHAAQA